MFLHSAFAYSGLAAAVVLLIASVQRRGIALVAVLAAGLEVLRIGLASPASAALTTATSASVTSAPDPARLAILVEPPRVHGVRCVGSHCQEGAGPSTRPPSEGARQPRSAKVSACLRDVTNTQACRTVSAIDPLLKGAVWCRASNGRSFSMLPTRTPRVKVCCIRSVQEAWMAVEAGASAVGLVSHMPSGPGVIDEETIREIAGRVPPPVATFLLTSLTDPEEVVAQHARCRTTTIQLCDYLDPGAHALLRRRLPGIHLVQVIHVQSYADVERAVSVASAVDAILLDSGSPGSAVKRLGGTGCIHDWGLSLAIRERVDVPVFLAGGLSNLNVAAAVRDVGPFGLDLCSGIRTDDRLDSVKLSAFFAALRGAIYD